MQWYLFRSGIGIEQVTPVDAGQCSAADGWCQPLAILLDEEIADRSLGDLVAFIQEEHFDEAVFESPPILLVIEAAAGGLVAQKAVAGRDSD